MKRGILLLTMLVALMASSVNGVTYAFVSRPTLQIPPRNTLII